MSNQQTIINRIQELYRDGLVDEQTPITTVLEIATAEFYELDA